jgi:hypothetical protein
MSNINFERAIELATAKVLKPGYKPEDYLVAGDSIPIRIAKLIVEEAKHIMEMHAVFNRSFF